MSALTPYIYPPYPVPAADEAAQPYETQPVESVSAPAPVRPVESEEDRPPEDFPVTPDAVALSETVRTVASEAARARRFVAPDMSFNPARDGGRIRNNRGIRDLIAGFENYDNTVARTRFDAALNVLAAYGVPGVPAAEAEAVAEIRARENTAYHELGFFPGGVLSRAARVTLGRAVDRWLAGNGVFVPSFLAVPGSDGFRFAPLTERARISLRAADVLATYDRQRIAAYLRETAALAPGDFLFYDPTGLGALPLEERRRFLARVEQLLEQARAERRAAELQYYFDEQEQLDIDRMELDDEAERRRIEALSGEISGYYGMLLQSVRQYSAGIISDALS